MHDGFEVSTFYQNYTALMYTPSKCLNCVAYFNQLPINSVGRMAGLLIVLHVCHLKLIKGATFDRNYLVTIMHLYVC